MQVMPHILRWRNNNGYVMLKVWENVHDACCMGVDE